MKTRFAARCGGALILAAALAGAGDAAAEDAAAWTRQLVYTADVGGVLSGGETRAGRALDNLDLIVDGDLERAAGWRGAKLHLYVLNNTGGRPNDLAGTLQGVDNIEVGRARLRLFELWIEQALAGGRASLRVGLYDLNSEFYSTDASGLLIAPPFGIGSELSATGRNGPSIFPSTSLGARLRMGGEAGPYVQAAALGADARTLGDPKGVDTRFRDGVLYVGEAGWRGRRRLSLGVWSYGRRQDDLRELTPAGDPAKRRARGAYVLVETPLPAGRRRADGFLRAGVSDGDTGPFRGAWQAGFKVEGVTPGRPSSAISLGVQQGLVSAKARANARDAGLDAARAESGIEITYTDTLGRLSIQPDLQVIRHPGGDRGQGDEVVGAVRFTLDLS